MRIHLWFISILVTLFSMMGGNAFAQGANSDYNFKNAFDYNNFIVKEISYTVQKNFEYIAFSVHSDEYDQLESKRQEVIAGIVAARNRISLMPPLNGETRLRDDAVGVLIEYQHAFEQDYQHIIHLKRKSHDSLESMQAYFGAEDDAEAQVHKATRRLLKAQEDFARKNNLNVVNGKTGIELEQKMDNVIAVNNYWRAIFLDYFKVSIQYDKMWDELPGQKASAIEHERQTVLKTIGEVLPELRKKSDFRGNAEFRDQTIGVLEYYQHVSAVDFARIVELLGKKKMPQPEVDEINLIISHCNADHERLTYNWNISLQYLLKSNVEKE